ncbi:MAG: hypothetical protein WCY11_21320, partial [Novosphingobium sp.]
GLHVSDDYLPEALDRELPGDGDFPLLDLLRALPSSTALDVEVPSVKRAAQGISGSERAREAVARVRDLLSRAGATE